MRSFSRRALNRLLFSLSMFSTMLGIWAYHQPQGLSVQSLKDFTAQVMADREQLAVQTMSEDQVYENPGDYEVHGGDIQSTMTAEEFRKANQNNPDLNTEEMSDYLDYFTKMESAISSAASQLNLQRQNPTRENKASVAEEITPSGADQKLSIVSYDKNSLVIELDKSEAGKKRK